LTGALGGAVGTDDTAPLWLAGPVAACLWCGHWIVDPEVADVTGTG
jgi:hypothetical protein